MGKKGKQKDSRPTSIGAGLAKKILEGESFQGGEHWPPSSEYRIEVTEFKFFRSAEDDTEIFVIEAKCTEVVDGGEAYGEGKYKVRAVKPGMTRSQVIKMDKQPAAGNVAQFLSAALASELEFDGNVPWQDLEVLDGLLKYYGVKMKKASYPEKVSALLGILTDPEEKPLNGIELTLNTRVKITKKAGTPFTTHWYDYDPGYESNSDEG